MNELFYPINTNLPRLEVTVSGNGAAEDLTNATGLIFQYKPRYTGSSSILSGQFSNKGSGIIYVDLTGTTFSDSVGPLWGRFIIYFQNGGRRAYPSDSYINIGILSGLV